MRPIVQKDIDSFSIYESLYVIPVKNDGDLKVSISSEDLKGGSPKIGDMIARNPKNHLDQWLVAEQYFKENFEQ